MGLKLPASSKRNYMFELIKKLIGSFRKRERLRLASRLGKFSIDNPALFQAEISFGYYVNSERCEIEVGDNSLVNGTVHLERSNARLKIGQNSSINGGTMFVISDEINIGNNVWISFDCLILDQDGHASNPDIRRQDLPDFLAHRPKNWSVVKISPVKIEDDVWVGARVIILKGVTVGRASIIGAGSVVTKNIPPYSIVAGNPAVIVGKVFVE